MVSFLPFCHAALILPPLSTTAERERLHAFSPTANWLVPGRVLCGRYPGSCPSRPIDSTAQRDRLSTLREHGIDTFVCLQSELPPQDAVSEWPEGGIEGQSKNVVEKQTARFQPYFDDAGGDAANYVHFSIPDRCVASSLESLDALVHDLYTRVLDGERLYIHCFGGRGRTGIVAACLLGALYPELTDPDEALERVHGYYSLRGELYGSSPETDEQKQQVKDWFKWVKGGAIRVAKPRPRAPPPMASMAAGDDGEEGDATAAYISDVAKWVTSSGGDVSSVRIGEVDGMRGGVLDEELSKAMQAELMAVPAALAISDDPDEILSTPLGGALGRSGLALLQPDAHLALRLLHEHGKGEASVWHSYLQTLPKHVRTARHLSDEALLACRSPFIMEQAMLARKYVSSLYGTLRRLLLSGKEAEEEAVSASALTRRIEADALLSFDEATLGWAMDIVHSRSFSVDVGGPRGMRRFLVPYIDMLNHNPLASCGFTYDDSEEPACFIVGVKGEHALLAPEGPSGQAPPKTLLQSGSQVWLDYGAQSSEELLLMYGFVPDAPTPHDTIELEGAYTPLDMKAASGDANMREEKEALLTSCRYDPPRTFLLGSAGSIDPGVITALRLIYLERSELEEAGSNWNRPLLHAPVSAANEKRVATALRARLSKALEEEGGAPVVAEEEEDDDEDEDEADEREQMQCARQIVANRRAVLSESITRLDGFLARVESSSEGDDGKVLNLLDDCFEDYMPGIRLL